MRRQSIYLSQKCAVFSGNTKQTKTTKNRILTVLHPFDFTSSLRLRSFVALTGAEKAAQLQELRSLKVMFLKNRLEDSYEFEYAIHNGFM